jgi:hypothetical protein
MKTFLDRFGFLFHRPRYFAKAATSLVTQGIFGGASIVKYLHFVARGLGTRPVRGVCLTTLEPSTEKVRLRNAKLIRKQAQRFRQTLFAAQRPRPSLLSLLLFRISRTSIRSMLDATACDYRYFAEQGWFSSDYYYPVSLSWIAKGMGRLFDKLAQMKYSRPLVSAK